jgi:regulatory protein
MRRPDALQRALELLRYRPRSEAEVRRKLAEEGFAERAVRAAVARLRELKALDDALLARNWIASRTEGRGYGPLRLARELEQRGVARPLIRAALAEVWRDRDAAAAATALLSRKFGGHDLRDPKMLRRAVAFLRRRGYPDGAIAAALKIAPAEE